MDWEINLYLCFFLRFVSIVLIELLRFVLKLVVLIELFEWIYLYFFVYNDINKGCEYFWNILVKVFFCWFESVWLYLLR